MDRLTEMTCFVRAVEKDGRAETVMVAGRLEVNDGRSLIAEAVAGLGIVLQDVEILKRHVAAGELEILQPAYTGPSRELHVVYPPGRLVSPKLRSFVDALAASLGPTSHSTRSVSTPER